MELKVTANPIDGASATAQVLSNLFSGWGYNFYRSENQLRADDLLIRSKLSELLGQSRAHLASIEASYRREHLPPPTREHPFPDSSAVVNAQALQRVQREIESIETLIRTASVPEMDRVHQRYRSEGQTLKGLVAVDMNLVEAVKSLHDIIGALNDGATAAEKTSALLEASRIETIWRHREQVLSISMG